MVLPERKMVLFPGGTTSRLGASMSLKDDFSGCWGSVLDAMVQFG